MFCMGIKGNIVSCSMIVVIKNRNIICKINLSICMNE